jgi:hypothetical protein
MSKYLAFLLTLSLLACSLPSPTQTAGKAPTQTVGTTPTVPIISPTRSPMPHTTVDASTMKHKLLMGYQGWFSCPDDGSRLGGFVHWFKGEQPTAANLRVDMWPDASELTPEEYCETDMVYPSGQPAYLYSAYNPVTVMRHFEWMSEYGVDGVFVQRFGAILSDPGLFDQRNVVTRNVQAGAEAYGRVFANMYDVSGMDGETLIPILGNDWKYMVDVLKVTESPSYLRHNGKPVLAIWGLGFAEENVTPAEALALVDFFVNNPEPRYRVTLMGGVPTSWRTLQGDSQSDPAWMDYYCSLDVISPWTVGRFTDIFGVDLYKAVMQKDMAVAAACGVEYMPVVFPGTAFHNDSGSPFNSIPRMGGKLYWRQVYNAISINAPMLYNAMFDEVDEATAMFKIAATAADQPVGADLIAMDTDGYSLPSDWYLRLAGSATQMLRGEIPLTGEIPIFSGAELPPALTGAVPIRIQLLTTSDWSTWTVQAGGRLIDPVLVSSSPEITDIWSTGNGFTIVQPIDRANSGASVILVVDALLIDWQPGSPLQLLIESGAIGYTTVTLYDASREPSVEIASTTHYEMKLQYEVSTDLFRSP